MKKTNNNLFMAISIKVNPSLRELPRLPLFNRLFSGYCGKIVAEKKRVENLSMIM